MQGITEKTRKKEMIHFSDSELNLHKSRRPYFWKPCLVISSWNILWSRIFGIICDEFLEILRRILGFFHVSKISENKFELKISKKYNWRKYPKQFYDNQKEERFEYRYQVLLKSPCTKTHLIIIQIVSTWYFFLKNSIFPIITNLTLFDFLDIAPDNRYNMTGVMTEALPMKTTKIQSGI
ncbi:Protein CBG04854 [Caenorhabditis briggsae]|uniref:Protein CBG04854 n=1 Tax=Caenorhabditis briggsae TaxID=6238 RepID=A8WYM6_CAEBR|nr:Protein CBG04854 [Caenorhabditis briggsae]CAP25484.1 Protein CBG04854 [Caenorhabditis briggsae]